MNCRAKSPSTNGHKKTSSGLPGCGCDHCEFARARDRARRPPLIRGPKIISPDTNGHRKRLVKDCECEWCKWAREKSRLSARARLAIPKERKKIRARQRELREQRRKPRIYVSPAPDGHTRSGSRRGCYCAYCKWERNRIKEGATARRRREGAAFAAVTPATNGHSKRLVTGCICEWCEWRREGSRRKYRELNPETDHGRLRAASPPTSGHPKNRGVVRHCKCAWCEWRREISRSRGELKDAYNSPAASGHPKSGQLKGCYCDYCEWCRNRARERVQKKREARTPNRPPSPPTSGHVKNGGQLRGCYCDYCEWSRERRRRRKRERCQASPPTSGHPKKSLIGGCRCDFCEHVRKRAREIYRHKAPLTKYAALRASSPPTRGHPKRGQVGGCKCAYCEWIRARRRPRNRMSARLKSRKKKEAVKAAVDQILEENSHLKKLTEAL